MEPGLQLLGRVMPRENSRADQKEMQKIGMVSKLLKGALEDGEQSEGIVDLRIVKKLVFEC